MDKNNAVYAIKEELKKRKMTYKELSEASGVPLDTLNNFFRGKTKNPRVDTMEAIEKALGIGGQAAEWTEEDKKLGVGSHPTVLSGEEWEWLELRSEVLRLKGKDYLEMLERMVKAAIEIK